MSDGNPDFRSSLRRVLREENGEDHPSPETLESFHWGDLPADRADRVRVHLSHCASCLGRLAQLDEMEDAAAAAEVEVPPGELERSLVRLRERLHTEGADEAEETGFPTPPPLSSTSRTRFFPRWSRAPGPYLLAAASLVAGIGLSLWLANRLAVETQRLPELESRLAAATARTATAEERLEEARQQARSFEQRAIALRRERDELLAPQANTPIVDLRVSGERGGESREVTEVRLAPGVRFVTLVLEDPGEQPHSKYRLEVLDQRGGRVAQVAGLHRTRYRNFVVTLPRALLRRGEYRLRLVRLEAGSGKQAALYSLRMEDE